MPPSAGRDACRHYDAGAVHGDESVLGVLSPGAVLPAWRGGRHVGTLGGEGHTMQLCLPEATQAHAQDSTARAMRGGGLTDVFANVQHAAVMGEVVVADNGVLFHGCLLRCPLIMAQHGERSSVQSPEDAAGSQTSTETSATVACPVDY